MQSMVDQTFASDALAKDLQWPVSDEQAVNFQTWYRNNIKPTKKNVKLGR